MKYYKLSSNNIIIGAINSNNFIQYQPITGCFLLSNEEEGEYIDYQGTIYRATWMRPVTYNLPFTTVQAIEITEEEYIIYTQAIDNNETIEDDTAIDPIPIEPYIDPNDIASLEFIRSSKIQEMSYECHKTIEAGFDLELQGAMHHFSLTTQDQLNLMSLSTLAQTQSLIPYHADGEECVFYSAEDINKIIETATNLKIYQTTYYNSLKTYINALETIEEIAAIEYGIPIPEEYKSDALKILEM